MCGRTSDFRFQHATVHGGNKFLTLVRNVGKRAFTCRVDGKLAFATIQDAAKYPTPKPRRAYYDERCGFNHLTSQLQVG